MKAQEGAAVRPPQENAQAKSATGEWDGKVVSMGEEYEEIEETTETTVLAMEASAADGKGKGKGQSKGGRPNGEERDANLPRERRRTVVSSIPAQLAKSMGEIREPGFATPAARAQLPRPTGAPRDAGVPVPMPHEVTRRVNEGATTALLDAEEESTDTYSVELLDDSNLPPLAQVQALIDSAHNYIEGGNLGAAVIAADQALVEAAKTPQQEVADLVKTSRPLFDRIFAAYVGLLGQVPVRMRSDEEIAGQELGERTEYLLASIDGTQTLEQLATSTGIPPVEAMKIAASLLAAGIVRVEG